MMKINPRFLIILMTAALFSCSGNQDAHNDQGSSKDSTALSENEAGEEEDQNNSCAHIAIKILTTSPAYLERTDGLYEAVVANGGTSFGISLEGSPDPDRDGAMSHSETYDFSLHETYPDHSPVIEHFTFNPSEGKLYLRDIAEGELVPMEFDKKLLKRFNEFCK